MSFEAVHFDTNKPVIKKERLQLENKQNIEQQEQYLNTFLNQELTDLGHKEKYPKGIEVSHLQKNVFLVIDKNTNNPKIFVDKKGDVLLSLITRMKYPLIKNADNGNPGKALLKSGFVFGKNLELHKIVGYKNGKLQISGKVDTHSKEYYQAWKKILYNEGLLEIKIALNYDDKTKYNRDSFLSLLETGAMTQELVEKFNQKGILTEEDYQFGLDFFNKQEEQEKNKTHIDEAIDNINSRLNGIIVEMPQKV